MSSDARHKALEKSMESLATSMQLARFFLKKICVADTPPYTVLAWQTQRGHVASYNLDCK